MDSGASSLTAWSHGLVGASYLAFALRLLQLGYHRKARGASEHCILAAVVASALWGWLGLAFLVTGKPGLLVVADLSDLLRYGFWFAFMLLLFREGHQEFSFRFRAALAEGDMRSATRLVHNLGSVAGTIGADTLRQRSVALESACSRAADRAEIDALHDAVEVELLPVMTGLRELA